MLLFLDLETTELDTTHAEILEVACIVTDDNFVEKWRTEATTDAILGMQDWHRVPAVVRKMHADNGLWGDCIQRGMPLGDIDEIIADRVRGCLIAGPGLTAEPLINLAGNSVWFDHNMVRRQMPKLAALLSHRHLDVTSFNELARRQWPTLYAARPDFMTHRAMKDAECSLALALARYYREVLAPKLLPNYGPNAAVCGSWVMPGPV